MGNFSEQKWGSSVSAVNGSAHHEAVNNRPAVAVIPARTHVTAPTANLSPIPAAYALTA